MQCAFAQVCRDYRHEFTETSPFHLFGRRDHTCQALPAADDQEVSEVAAQFESMEKNTEDLETCLGEEMTRTDDVEKLVGHLLEEKTQW